MEDNTALRFQARGPLAWTYVLRGLPHLIAHTHTHTHMPTLRKIVWMALALGISRSGQAWSHPQTPLLLSSTLQPQGNSSHLLPLSSKQKAAASECREALWVSSCRHWATGRIWGTEAFRYKRRDKLTCQILPLGVNAILLAYPMIVS